VGVFAAEQTYEFVVSRGFPAIAAEWVSRTPSRQGMSPLKRKKPIQRRLLVLTRSSYPIIP
jgi:hypothetical protein